MNGKILKIDIKEGMPPVDVAIFNLDREIELGKLSGIKVIKVIHGYGSHGKGGAIKVEARAYLKKQKKAGKIKNYIGGEGWSTYKVKELDLLEIAPELLLNLDGESFNPGMTIVLL